MKRGNQTYNSYSRCFVGFGPKLPDISAHTTQTHIWSYILSKSTPAEPVNSGEIVALSFFWKAITDGKTDSSAHSATANLNYTNKR